VSCGNQFAVLLQSNGCLQTFGENLEGELGHGDTIVRTDPCLIERLANQGEKIMQVECGFKHVVARSNNKVFTWGWGEKGQLGLGSYANEVHSSFIHLVKP
jgi:alpha-tubulin suppressor-like RCC1 family protein